MLESYIHLVIFIYSPDFSLPNEDRIRIRMKFDFLSYPYHKVVKNRGMDMVIPFLTVITILIDQMQHLWWEIN